ncbi:MAG: hypothetical protein IJ523_05080 [Succinivibrionaceae bacterium]|nr:hypothetical protein [Succinivibrionaceae bacterium]
MSKKNSELSGFGFLDFLQLCCYCFVCSVIGFAVVWTFFWVVDGSPESVCGELKQSFKMNDTFDYASCRLENDDEIRLVLDVRKGMEVYFRDLPKQVDDSELSSTQLDYYCGQIFDRVRISSLELSIRVDRKISQRIHVNRSMCM